MIIETIEDSAKKTLNIPSTFLTEQSTHTNLVVEVTQSWQGTAKLALFLDCSPLGLVTLSKSMRDMMFKVKPPLVRAVSHFWYQIRTVDIQQCHSHDRTWSRFGLNCRLKWWNQFWWRCWCWLFHRIGIEELRCQ